MSENLAGLDCMAYLNTGASWDNPTWTEMENIRDLSIPAGKGEIEFTKRGITWKKTKGGLKTLELSFGYLHAQGNADTVFEDLMESYLNNTPVDLALMDGDITEDGTVGWRAPFEVMSMEQGQELEGAVSWQITAKLTCDDDDNDPEWMEIVVT